ncbi:MAG: glycosyltransferase family 1 protein [Gluconobacter cerinus]|uniref:glycosyltransferase family 4 protein n=1 Tax=Gluconobacter cerinus TaxID=38307 RepID=UPI0039E8B724
MTLWVDIDDLLFHLLHHSRPSGIQRVVFEICAALRELRSHEVQFVRRGADSADPRGFRTVDWSSIETLFRQIMEGHSAQNGSSRSAGSFPVTPPIEKVASQDVLSTFLQAESWALKELVTVPRALGHFALDLGRAKIQERQQEKPSAQYDEGTKLADAAQPGDVFLTLGAPWHHANYVQSIRWMRDELRMSFGMLMHDLVPVRHPEWCDRGIIITFKAWHSAILPLADMIFANSDSTARDVQSYLAEQDVGTHVTVQTVPLGTGFGLADAPMAPEPIVQEPYVLFVSTIEARKNHALLFRVWRRMLEEMSAENVPTLVFAGREGWLVSDLMQQLENAEWLDGKIRFIQNPTDAELRRLYADCSFTIFPSFFEGWGLPVTESLSMGRPCLASGTTSIPEAGGQLSRYFNPDNINEAYTLIRKTIEDTEGLKAWTEQVRSEFQPVPWTESAKAILKFIS